MKKAPPGNGWGFRLVIRSQVRLIGRSVLVLAAKLLETKFFVDNDDLHNVHIAHFLVVNGKGVADSIRRGAIITMILFNGTWSLGEFFVFYNITRCRYITSSINGGCQIGGNLIYAEDEEYFFGTE